MGNKDERYDGGDGQDGDDLDQWYRDVIGNTDAAGVGPIDFNERARREAAPLRGPRTFNDDLTGPTDFVSAARKAVQAAAAAANEHSQNNKAYYKLSVSMR